MGALEESGRASRVYCILGGKKIRCEKKGDREIGLTARKRDAYYAKIVYFYYITRSRKRQDRLPPVHRTFSLDIFLFF